MSPNRAKTASAFTDYKGQGVVVLICFGLPHYPEQGAHQAETTRSRPFATPKSSFPGCFPSEKVVLFIAIKHSFLHPSGEFQRAASKTNFQKDDERKKEIFFFLITSWLESPEMSYQSTCSLRTCLCHRRLGQATEGRTCMCKMCICDAKKVVFLNETHGKW